MRFRVIPYERLFRMRRLPRATFIFTDFDRLDFWDLEMAARVYRRVREAGARALNDPARVSSRFRLLRDLRTTAGTTLVSGGCMSGRQRRRFPYSCGPIRRIAGC